MIIRILTFQQHGAFSATLCLVNLGHCVGPAQHPRRSFDDPEVVFPRANLAAAFAALARRSASLLGAQQEVGAYGVGPSSSVHY